MKEKQPTRKELTQALNEIIRNKVFELDHSETRHTTHILRIPSVLLKYYDPECEFKKKFISKKNMKTLGIHSIMVCAPYTFIITEDNQWN